MAAEVRGSTAAALTSSGTQITLNYPAGVVSGDRGVMVAIYAPGTAVPNTPTNWTVVDTVSVGSAAVRLYERNFTGSPPASLTATWASGQRFAMAMVVLTGVEARDGWDENSASSSPLNTLSIPAATVAATDHCFVTFMCERTGTAPSTLFTPSDPLVPGAGAYGSGNGSCSVRSAWSLTPDADGSVGFGSWDRNSPETSNIAALTIPFPITPDPEPEPEDTDPPLSLSRRGIRLGRANLRRIR